MRKLIELVFGMRVTKEDSYFGSGSAHGMGDLPRRWGV